MDPEPRADRSPTGAGGMDAEERDLFAKSLLQVTAQHSGEALDAALVELGWRDALAADQRVAVSELFERQGAANATSSALDQVVLAALGMDAVPGDSVVLPRLGRGEPPGAAVGDCLAVRGLATGALRRADRVVVPAAAGNGTDETVAAVVATGDLVVRTVHGLDPDLGLVEVGGDQVPPTSRSDPLPLAWSAVVAAGQRALAHELVGGSRTMLELAREHALERLQFGRPIASFQAVRHRLADTLVAIEAADAALDAAWQDGSPQAAALAKAIAGRGARTAARHCQQVLAGIGFTSEHALHRYVRRVLVLDRMLGDARSLTRQLGDDVIAHRALPALLPL